MQPEEDEELELELGGEEGDGEDPRGDDEEAPAELDHGADGGHVGLGGVGVAVGLIEGHDREGDRQQRGHDREALEDRWKLREN